MPVIPVGPDTMQRTLFYRTNRDGVPVKLPFTRVEWRGETYYEPEPYETLSAQMKRQEGAAVAVEYVPRNMAFPVAPAHDRLHPERYGVWSYYGM